MKWLKSMFWPSVFGLMIVVSVTAVFGSMMTAPQASPGPESDGRFRNVSFRSTDGYVIAASYWAGHRSNSQAILLLHGNGASRATMANYGRWLNDMGYAVLAIDFRGHGESDQVRRSFGLFESREAQAAYDWLEAKQNGAPIGVIGISLGGAAALLGEQGPLPAKCMVLQAVYPDIRSAIYNRLAAGKAWPVAWAVEPFLSYQSRVRFGVWPSRISPINAVSRYKGQAFFIGGADDAFTPPDEVRAMADAFSGEKTLWIVKGKDHAEISSESSRQYKDRVLSFFDGCLGSPLIPDLPPPVVAPANETTAQPVPPLPTTSSNTVQGQNP